MLFSFKKLYVKKCEKCSKDILALMKTVQIADIKKQILDIPALMYTIVFYITYCSPKFDTIVEQTLHWIVGKCRTSEEIADFKSRADFYLTILDGAPVHGHCIPGMLASTTDDPVTRCVIAFTDRVQNPAYIDDYQNAPAPIFSALESFSLFNSFMMPLAKRLLIFAKTAKRYAK